ncbi:MAG: hypothetical protein IJE05_05230 [Clostridia bacterium]|nr:hypothetical protein [Clostridia bacterium]
MTQKITLQGPETTTVIEGNPKDEVLFNKFLSWLKKYHPTKKFSLDCYPVKSENHLIACRIKAKKLGLKVES